MPNTYDDILLMFHDEMNFTASIGLILSDCEIIGSYVDDNGWSHVVYRDSLYGKLILEAFQDSRKYNPNNIPVLDK